MTALLGTPAWVVSGLGTTWEAQERGKIGPAMASDRQAPKSNGF